MNETNGAGRWTREVEHLRARAEKLRRREPANATGFANLLDEALSYCVTLIQELAHRQESLIDASEQVRAAEVQWEAVYAQLPVPCVSTDADGQITNANAGGAALLNVSAKYLRERLLLHFVDDRDTLREVLLNLSHNEPFKVILRLRPRDRAPFLAPIVVVPELRPAPTTWFWFIIPESASFAIPLRADAAGNGTRLLTDIEEPSVHS